MSLTETSNRSSGGWGGLSAKSPWSKPNAGSSFWNNTGQYAPNVSAATFGNDIYDSRARLAEQYLNSQMGWQNQGYGLGQAELQSGYGFDTQRLGLERQALGVDQGAVRRQQDYYNKLFGIDTGRYERGVAFNNALKGFRSTDQGSTLHDLWAQASQVRNKAARDTREMRRTQTAAGAFTSQGTKDAAGDITDTRDYALTGIDIARKQADTAYRRDQAGYDNTIANLTSDFQETGLNHQEQQARLRDRMSTLDIESQKLGISGSELSTKLAQGLERLKLNHTVSVGQLLDALNQNAIGQTGNAMQSFLQALGI